MWSAIYYAQYEQSHRERGQVNEYVGRAGKHHVTFLTCQRFPTISDIQRQTTPNSRRVIFGVAALCCLLPSTVLSFARSCLCRTASPQDFFPVRVFRHCKQHILTEHVMWLQPQVGNNTTVLFVQVFSDGVRYVAQTVSSSCLVDKANEVETLKGGADARLLPLLSKHSIWSHRQ